MKKFLKSFVGGKVLERKGDTAMMGYILYCLILAVVIVGLMQIYNRSIANNKFNDFSTQVPGIVASLQSMYKGQPYETMPSADLFRAGIYPQSINKGGNAINPWNGQYLYEGNGSTFTLTIDSMPKDACTKAAQLGTDWVSVELNGTRYTAENLPIKPQDAAGNCTKANNANTVVYESY